MKKCSSIITVVFSCLMLTSLSEAALGEDNIPDMSSIHERLQKLEDREAVKGLLIKYGRLLDEEDFLGYSKLFAKDGIWEGGIGSAKGPEEIFNMLNTVFGKVTRDQYGNSYHIMSDIIIDIDGDTATSRSNWTWVVEGKEGNPVIQRSGHYEDILVREAGKWRFKHRLTVTEMPTEQKDSESHLFRSDWEVESGSD